VKFGTDGEHFDTFLELIVIENSRLAVGILISIFGDLAISSLTHVPATGGIFTPPPVQLLPKIAN